MPTRHSPKNLLGQGRNCIRRNASFNLQDLYICIVLYLIMNLIAWWQVSISAMDDTSILTCKMMMMMMILITIVTCEYVITKSIPQIPPTPFSFTTVIYGPVNSICLISNVLDSNRSWITGPYRITFLLLIYLLFSNFGSGGTQGNHLRIPDFE